MSGQQLTEGDDYKVVDDTICIFDHVEITTSVRAVADETGVSLVPARGLDVVSPTRSASYTGSDTCLLYRGGEARPVRRDGGRKAPRYLPRDRDG